MNKPTSDRRSNRVLAAWVTLFVLVGWIFNTGCANPSPRVSSSTPAGRPSDLASTTPVPDKSLYQLDSSWTNDMSVALPLVSLRGRPQIMALFFARCEYACPILVHDMKRIEAAIPISLRTNIGFVLVSFDTERDTAAALATYRRNHELAANWTLLRGGSDDVLELAALLGVKFKKDARGQFAHSNLITVLDANGEIVRQQIGLNQSVDDIVATLEQLATPR